MKLYRLSTKDGKFYVARVVDFSMVMFVPAKNVPHAMSISEIDVDKFRKIISEISGEELIKEVC